MLNDREHLNKYQEIQKREKELLSKIARLEEENQKLRISPASANKQKKEELKKQFRETTQGLTAGEWNQKALALRFHGFYTDVDKVLEYLNRAIRLDPNYWAAYTNLGAAYHDKGDYDRSIEYFQKDLKITIKKLGPEHLDVAFKYNILGYTKATMIRLLNAFKKP